jgi:hypothetical protein
MGKGLLAMLGLLFFEPNPLLWTRCTTRPVRRAIAGKVCSRCGTWKEPGEYGKDRGKKSGLRSYCKTCRAEYAAKYIAKPENKKHRAEYYAEYIAKCRQDPERWLYHKARKLIHKARQRADKEGVKFDLDRHIETIKAWLRQGVSQLTGDPINLYNNKICDSSPNLDRILAGADYTLENTRLIRRDENTMLNKYGTEGLLSFARKLQGALQ